MRRQLRNQKKMQSLQRSPRRRSHQTNQKRTQRQLKNPKRIKQWRSLRKKPKVEDKPKEEEAKKEDSSSSTVPEVPALAKLKASMQDVKSKEQENAESPSKGEEKPAEKSKE